MRYLVLLFLLAACTTIPSHEGVFDVHFCQVDDCEAVLLDAINSSKDVRCAFYDLDLPELKSMLKEKNAVVLVDEDNYDGFGQEIRGSGLMHHKYCVVNNVVITGSMNPTYNGVYKNDNNLLIIENPYLVKNYLQEFEELKGAKNKNTPHSKVIHNGFLIENYFCPEDDCEEHVLEALESAQQSIYFMTFSFTSDPIGELLVQKHDEGVIVEGVFEARGLSRYSELHRLNQSGILVIKDKNKATMHHKVFIIDESVVITGSYNPTKNGNENNQENVLIIHSTAVAKQFLEEYERIALFN